MEQIRKGTVRLYAAGGCGMNIGSLLEKYRGVKNPGFAELDICYLDTSASNMRDHIDDDHCYLIDGMDGSGKLRTENHLEINDRVRAVLQKFKPADLNIVLSSGGGGSGSVFSPLVARELLANENPVIVLLVGSADTRLDCENTLKTIKSYESVSKMSKTPLVMLYVQNTTNTTREMSDNSIINAIMSLLILYSRENREIDSKDLFNWLRFDRVTTFHSQLACLTLLVNRDIPEDLGNIISVATLVNDGMHTSLPSMPEYQCSGFLPNDIDKTVQDKAPIHFIVSDGIIHGVAKQLQDILTQLQKAQDARIKVSGVMSTNDKAHDSGLVL